MPLDNSAEYANHIPDAIRRQAARAEEIAREVYAPEGDANTTVVENGEPAPAPAAEPAPAPAPAAEDFEQKYRTLQGKYESEMAAQRSQNAQLVQTVANMERVLANLSERHDEPKPVEHKPTTVVGGPTDKDREEYGEELITAAQRWVQPLLTKYEQRITSLESELKQTKDTTTRTVQTVSQQSVMQQLDADPELGRPVEVNGSSAPNWRVINEDPTFISWLQQPDPISGQQRMGLLRDAFAQGNAARMKAVFGAFVKEHTVVEAAPVASSTHTPASAGTGRVPLENFAAPGRPSGAAPVGAPGEKRTWTQREISDFYRRVQKGEFLNNPAEKGRLEQDLVNAAMEGRVLKR